MAQGFICGGHELMASQCRQAALAGYYFLCMIELSETIGRLAVHLQARLIGPDWSVIVYGGHRPHIGAVALADPSGLCSIVCLPGHREGGIAERIASAIANHTNVSVCVACGIHLDDMTQDEILLVHTISEKFISEFVARV